MYSKRLLLAIILSFGSPALGFDTYPKRTWTDATGKFKVEASCVKVHGKYVKLQTETGKEIDVLVDRLCDKDKVFLEICQTIEDDKDEFRILDYHFQRMAIDPQEVKEVLSKQVRRDSKSPYLAFGLGLCAIAIDGNYEEAEKHFSVAAGRILTLRRAMPGAYPETLIAALNNRAVCQLKQLEADTAVKTLLESKDSDGKTPFLTFHNASLLLEVGLAGGKSKIKLSEGSKRKLADMLAAEPPIPPIANVPNRYLFSFAINGPMDYEMAVRHVDGNSSKEPKSADATTRSSNQADSDGEIRPNQVAQNRSVPPAASRLSGDLIASRLFADLNCMDCSGKGVVRCPAGCNRGVTKAKTLKQVGYNPQTGPVMLETLVDTECKNCSGKGGFDCPSCVNGILPIASTR